MRIERWCGFGARVANVFYQRSVESRADGEELGDEIRNGNGRIMLAHPTLGRDRRVRVIN